jgi:hypothetical protein
MPRSGTPRLAVLLLAASPFGFSGCASEARDHPTATATGSNVTGGDPGPGGLYLTASGEATALIGYDFPLASGDGVFMVDGWSFHLDHELISIDHVTLWENPDTVPADQSQHGHPVAHADGPWVIDLHKGGPLTGEAGAPEQAQPFGGIKFQDDGAAFDTTRRYAFGFDTVSATAAATKVNLDADADFAYQIMVEKGYSVLYTGTASRPASDPCAGAGGSAYDFQALPRTVKVRLGFRTPTSYVNCQNGSQFPGVKGINGEDFPRGIQFRSDRSVIGQVTVHADHPFWESLAENSSLRFDAIAAQYIGVTDPIATVEDMRGVDFTAFTDRNGRALPMRTCVDASLYTPPYPAGQQLHFDPLKVPVDKTGNDPARALNDYADYLHFTQSTQGHLNSQGLCFVARNYPSPPGGS